MLKESITNVKSIGNGLVKSVTDRCPIHMGFLSPLLIAAVLEIVYKVRYR
jgi:hypothetical protein